MIRIAPSCISGCRLGVLRALPFRISTSVVVTCAWVEGLWFNVSRFGEWEICQFEDDWGEKLTSRDRGHSE